MFSDKSKNIADACRFCWMCRHVCPVGQQTGKEANNARAKGLFVSMYNRGTKFDASMANAMWECVLCGSCTNDCATGYEPPVFIREARTKAIVEGLAPANVSKLYETMTETGNIYGVPQKDKMQNIMKEIAKPTQDADALLYIGEVAAIKTPDIAKAVIVLMKKAGVKFKVLADEPSSGAYLGDLIGFVEDVRQSGKRLSKAIDDSGANKVVVIDPIDARIIKHEYAEWNIAPKAEVVTATSFIAELIKSGRLKPSKTELNATLHDAGALSRDLDETQPVRDILDAMGIDVKEMFLNRDLSRSSGGALFKQYMPNVAGLLAKARWDDAERAGVKTLITEAPGSYTALKDFVPDGMEIIDIFMLVEGACNL